MCENISRVEGWLEITTQLCDVSILSTPETFKLIPAAINPDKPKMLYSLVPSSLPLGKNEDMTITNKRRII